MTPETKSHFLKRFDLVWREITQLRSDLSLHRVGEPEGRELSIAFCAWQQTVKGITPEPNPHGPAPARAATAPMRPNRRGD